MNLAAPFIRRPVMTMMCVLMAVVFGVMSYIQLPINDLPAVETPVIVCTASYPGGSPQVMADNIATPLEKQFMEIQGLDLVTSQNIQGQTTITLQFSLSKSIDEAATDVQNAIQQALSNLPADIPQQPTYTKSNPNDKPILYLGFTSDTLTEGDLYDYANTQVAQRISMIEGVSQVSVYGIMSAVRIEANASALAARGLSLTDMVDLAEKGSAFQGAGQFDGQWETYQLNPQGQLEDAEQWSKLILRVQDGRPIFLRDVAQAQDSIQNTRYDFNFLSKTYGNPSAALIVAVTLASGSNAVVVSKKVQELMPEFRESLPAAIDFFTVHDRSQTIVESVDDVEETLVIAFVLVVAVIYIFLGRAVDTIIPSIALPLSLLLVFTPMLLLGYTLDNLSLMALTLSIGFLVDDAIVYLENTVRRMEAGEDAMTASINGGREIAFTILSMTLSLAAVFIPLAFMPGYVGRLFQEFGVVIMIAVVASGVVSMTVTPLMCSRMLGSRVGGRPTLVERSFNPFFKAVTRAYGNCLHFFLRHKWISVVFWAGALASTIWFYHHVPKSFLPVGDSGFGFGIFMAEGSASPDQMQDLQTRINAKLAEQPYVVQNFTLTGISSVIPGNQGLVAYFLQDGDRPPIQEINDQILDALREIPGVLPLVRPQPVLNISTGAISNNQGQYAYSITGFDPNQVYETSEKMMAAFRKIPGMGSVSSDLHLDAAQLKIDILRDRASLYGVTADAIEAVIRNAYAQNYIYLIKKSTEQYQVIVEVPPGQRANPDNLDLLWVTSSNAKLVPLGAVATWTAEPAPLAVNHINQLPSVTIFFDLRAGASIGPITEQIRTAAQEILPPAVQGNLEGEADLFQQMVSGLSVLLIFAVFVMYVILGILYESYLHPLTVLSALPVAMVGGLATLFVFGSELSLYSFIGLFMLMGIVKKNGIMMIDFALQRMDEGLGRYEAVHEACLERFRPIIMTTVAALMGAVPLAMGWGADGASRQPLGLIIVGGLVVSQVVTLFITPAIFLYFEAFQEGVLDRVPFFRSAHTKKQQLAGEGATASPVPAGAASASTE